MKPRSILPILAGVLLGGGAAAWGQLANVKVVTDASPDYSDLESMVHSITSRWETDAEKMWALFYWDHKARAQTTPMRRHGKALTDPIMQYNDFGYTMCSTISGIKCSVWNYMGYPSKYWDISLHTVPEVWYDGGWHHYDNSLSIHYTLCDGKTVAGIQDIGKTLACEASGGKAEPGHIAIYHAQNGTSVDGFIEGADTMRDLRHLGRDTFAPNALKYRWYYYDQDRGHRYILNLRDGEVYARHYSRQDANSPRAVATVEKQANFKSDPAYYIFDGELKDGAPPPRDLEANNPRYHLRGNGIRTFKPELTEQALLGAVHSATNVKALNPGLQPAAAGQPGEAVFKIEGANVLTSLKINAEFVSANPQVRNAIAISTNNGLSWTEVWSSEQSNSGSVDLELINGINGFYEALVKVSMLSPANPSDAQLKHITFQAITALNARTQPQLKLGKNTVYVGAGEQTGSIVLWPELQNDQYKKYVVEEKGIRSKQKHPGYNGVLAPERPEDNPQATNSGYVVFRVDAPQDITRITQGARMYVREARARIAFQHSFDNGQTWHESFVYADTTPPWDDIHHQVTENIPPGTRSVLFKYEMNRATLYSVRMEVNHKLAAPTQGPLEVTFDWSERQQDYSLVRRSHTQLVDRLPATYEINVGGYDHPVVNSLTVNLKGARGDVQYGYSDGKDVGGEKWVGVWATYGKNLALNKPYTVSVPSVDNWGAGDPEGKKLTDGKVGSSYSGGTSYAQGLIWPKTARPEIVVDLGSPQKAAAFRLHLHGFGAQDAIRGQVKDKVEVLSSLDAQQWVSHGNFDFNLYWKDIPVNYMYTDEQTFKANNHLLQLAEPAEMRYVKFLLTPSRMMAVTEVEVLDSVKFEPFDLRIALPDPASHGKFPPPATVSPNARQWKPGEPLPTDVGKATK